VCSYPFGDFGIFFPKEEVNVWKFKTVGHGTKKGHICGGE
jgi:hypothetical protein